MNSIILNWKLIFSSEERGLDGYNCGYGLQVAVADRCIK
jgi:hypothetical protein